MGQTELDTTKTYGSSSSYQALPLDQLILLTFINTYFLSTSWVPFARLGTGNIAVSRQTWFLSLMQLTVQRERQYHYKNNITFIKRMVCEDTVQSGGVQEHGVESSP